MNVFITKTECGNIKYLQKKSVSFNEYDYDLKMFAVAIFYK